MTHLEPFFMKAIKFYLQHQTNNTATKVYEDMGRRYWGGQKKIKRTKNA